MKAKKERQITGNMGMYFSSYKLSALGFNVMPTARNAKGVDLVVYTPDGKKYIGVQVKTVTNKWGVPLGKAKSEDIEMADYWVVVVLKGTNGYPDCYVLTPDEVKAGIYTDKKGGHWLEPKGYAHPEYKERWDLFTQHLPPQPAE
jgi:hypothetical protein